MTEKELLLEAYRITEELAENFPDYADILRQITYKSNRRITRCLGRAYRHQKVIELSIKMLPINQHLIRETVLHEVAHILAPVNVKHGKAWKDVYKQIGGHGEICIGYFTTLLPKRRYEVCCSNCGKSFTISPAQAGKIRAHGSLYHRGCGSVYLTGTVFKEWIENNRLQRVMEDTYAATT